MQYLFYTSLGLSAQLGSVSEIEVIYTNPAKSSIYNNPETTITVGFRQQLTPLLISKCDIQIKNSDGQLIEGEIIHPTNRPLLIYKPKIKLATNEQYFAEVLCEQKMIYRFEFFIDKGAEKHLKNFIMETSDLPWRK